MSLTFDVRELVRIAIIDERSGVQLYRKLADQVQTGRLRDRFRLMAEQERRHEERFEELLKGLPESAEIYKHPDEYVAYLEALVAEGRLREQSSRGSGAAQCLDDLAAINTAMEFERNQLGLMNEMSEVLGETENAVVKEIIAEEREHLVTLSSAKRELLGA